MRTISIALWALFVAWIAAQPLLRYYVSVDVGVAARVLISMTLGLLAVWFWRRTSRVVDDGDNRYGPRSD